uniref:C-glycoside deglycosidase beta subunit domain-containing protein n=1 Tax=Clostridium sp. 12(A) TaxID=1163671 RepID=UPI000464FC40|nr:DUF6379 domain-containing protein [Clostridium sp. 12(A)]
MFPKQMFHPLGFKNIEEDGRITGFCFEMKIQYYRGITLSILRNIEVLVDGTEYPRESIRFTVNGETFTLDEMRTVISNRWLFGQYGTVTVLTEGGLTPGSHHITCTQTIAPSYMPHILVHAGEYDFDL